MPQEDSKPMTAREELASRQDHERFLQRERQDREHLMQREKSAAELKHSRRTAFLTAGITLLGAVLTGVLTLLGTVYQAIHKSSDATKIEISQKSDLSPLKGLFDGVGVALRAAFHGTVAPDAKQLSPSVTVTTDRTASPAIVPETPAIAPQTPVNQPKPDLSQLCTTGSKDWQLTPEMVAAHSNANASSYTIPFRLKNNSDTDGFFSYIDQPKIADDAGNQMNGYASVRNTRNAQDGAKIAAGQESQFVVTSAPERTQLGSVITSLNMNLVVTSVGSGQSATRGGDVLSVGCSNIPVLKPVAGK